LLAAAAVSAVVDRALADIGGPVSLGPLAPAFGGADADAGQVSEDCGGKFGGQREAGGVAPGMGVAATSTSSGG